MSSSDPVAASADNAASNPDVTDVGCPKCDYGRGDCTCEEIAGQPAAWGEEES